ncbi:hotdog fold thioesterase [Quisquiliibacterium transsilvanicum]|uniref:8-oxo-dGTP diphosphatase n=1 Tax=Quisquiliibacterium transsilvanicum TaxID=1549638 RepID=A0A7W8HH57_9BURK|nr:hotdog fold thioesterase [Quisquiliibacterium transsilvanicum]MBB5271762.1 mutator protein MutT [Quisquiliibacterium transsilvanicum]
MSARSPLEVAVGVVFRADGAVLLGQRIPGKPYAGWWEFPGGKLEAGETVAQALARELHEELGLEVLASDPWVVREFTYPHARVRLHFRRVTEFSGAPRSREGQAFAWLHPEAIDVAPLLPATVPVIAWLRLPPELLRSAAAALGDDAFVDALQRRLRTSRSALLLLDEPALPAPRFERLFHRVLPLCRAHGVTLLVGPSHPASFARAAGGQLLSAPPPGPQSGSPSGPQCGPARAPLRMTGALVRDRESIARAAAAGLDFALLEGCPPAAWARMLDVAALPVYVATGGDGREVADAARAAGAHGVAPGAAVWQHEGPRGIQPGRLTMDLKAIEALFAPMFPGLMGVKIEEAEPDRVVASMRVRPDLCTAGENLHGGAFMAFADTLGAVATVLNMPAGARTTTIESKTNFMSGAPVGSTVRAVCTPLHRGRSTMVWQTEITSAAGKRCAIVIQTQMVLPGAPPA